MALVTMVKKGTTGYMIEVPVRSSADGQLQDGLADTSVTIQYQRQGAALPVTVDPIAGVAGTWASGSWVETIAGIYQIGVPNAAIVTGADYVIFVIKAANVIDTVITIYLTSTDLQGDMYAAIEGIRLNYTAVSALVGSATAVIRKRGNTWSISVTDLGSLVDYTSLWFTVKADTYKTDLQSALMIKKNASGVSDGIMYVNEVAASQTNGWGPKGSITITDMALGNLTIDIDESITALLVPGLYQIDIQTRIVNATATPFYGTLTIEGDITRATA